MTDRPTVLADKEFQDLSHVVFGALSEYMAAEHKRQEESLRKLIDDISILKDAEKEMAGFLADMIEQSSW